MKYANELWQADTMYGPSIKQPDGQWKKTFLIAFIDDASRVITHAEFFYSDNTENMIDAFRTALYKRGQPERLYFDNGSNYRSKEIAQACLRMGIKLIHTPVRDGAAKGKIERFFRGFRDRFLTILQQPQSLTELNTETRRWIEEEYNRKHHSSIQMIPVDRFALDSKRIQYITDDEYSEEIFFVEEDRSVSKTNTFSINNEKYECPVDLRDKRVQVRFDRKRRNRFIVYLYEKRMGEALPLNQFPKKHNLVLFGQPVLMLNLSMNINNDIKSRITYSQHIKAMNQDDLIEFVTTELERVGLGINTFDESALQLILRNALGNLRLLCNLCYGSLLEACRERQQQVSITHVNAILIQPHWRSHEDLIKRQVG